MLSINLKYLQDVDLENELNGYSVLVGVFYWNVEDLYNYNILMSACFHCIYRNWPKILIPIARKLLI